MAKLTASYEYTDAEMLALWRECYVTIAAKGQSYEFQGRTFTRADVRFVQQQIAWLENRVTAAGSGLIRTPIEFRRPSNGS